MTVQVFFYYFLSFIIKQSFIYIFLFNNYLITEYFLEKIDFLLINFVKFRIFFWQIYIQIIEIKILI